MSNILTWISDEIKKLTNWITGAEKTLSPVIDIAENVLNGIKNFEASAPGQLLESVVEAYIPASTGLINAFNMQLPVWLVELNWIKNETSKSLTEQWEDALSYLNSISDQNVKASQYNTLKALFSKFFADNQGVPATIQQ